MASRGGTQKEKKNSFSDRSRKKLQINEQGAKAPTFDAAAYSFFDFGGGGGGGDGGLDDDGGLEVRACLDLI